MITEIILLFLVAVIYISFHLNRRPNKFPPGPFSWPIVGNLVQLGTEPHKSILKMRDTYGSIIGIDFGARRSIFINDAKLMKEAFNLNALSGRPSFEFTLHPESKQKRGVIMTDGNQWVEQRTFVLKNLRNFGFGKKSMEALIQDEVKELMEGLEKTVGKPIDTHERFDVAVINALWTIVSGERFSHNDPKIKKLIDLLTANMSSTKLFTIAVPFPWLIAIAKEFSGYNEYVNNLLPVLNFIQGSINEHKKTYEGGFQRDLIDCFLQEIKKASPSSTFHKSTGDENTLMGVYDLFLAGVETTSKALSWASFLLAHFPQCQEKLNKSIIESVGRERRPCLTDRPNLPYLEAVLMEILRFSALTPFGAMHEVEEDVEFRGFNFPKGTMVIANLFGILHDPKVWGDPENFRPERFLSSDEKTVLRNEAFIPFSVGKRVCLGESLAKDELFLFTAAIFQQFQIEFDPNSRTPPLEHSKMSAVMATPKHKIVFADRYE